MDLSLLPSMMKFSPLLVTQVAKLLTPKSIASVCVRFKTSSIALDFHQLCITIHLMLNIYFTLIQHKSIFPIQYLYKH